MTFGNTGGATRSGLTFPFPFDEELGIELEFTTLLADNTENN